MKSRLFIASLAIIGLLWFLTWGDSHGDFIQFVTATHLLRDGVNPYLPDAMLGAQRAHPGFEAASSAMMYWSHPALLLLLPPFWFEGSVQLLALVWSGIAVGGFLLAIALSLPTLQERRTCREDCMVALAVAASGPFMMALSLGQSTMWLVLATALGYRLLLSQRFLGSGFFLSLLLCKPHLVMVLLAILGFMSAHSRECRRVLLGICLGCIVLTLSAEATFAGSISFWINTFLSDPSSAAATSKFAWVTATASQMTRSILPIWGEYTPILISLLAAATVIVASMRGLVDLSLRHSLAWLLPLSLLFAPFGWFYDAAILVVPQAIVSARLIRDSQRTVGLLALWNVAALALFAFNAFQEHHLYWWYPIGPLIAGAVYQRSLKKLEKI